MHCKEIKSAWISWHCRVQGHNILASMGKVIRLGEKALNDLKGNESRTSIIKFREIAKDLMFLHKGRIVVIILHNFIPCEDALTDLEHMVTLW
jgi:hypothetical protein